jgi:hypothetical protein
MCHTSMVSDVPLPLQAQRKLSPAELCRSDALPLPIGHPPVLTLLLSVSTMQTLIAAGTFTGFLFWSDKRRRRLRRQSSGVLLCWSTSIEHCPIFRSSTSSDWLKKKLVLYIFGDRIRRPKFRGEKNIKIHFSDPLSLNYWGWVRDALSTSMIKKLKTDRS